MSNNMCASNKCSNSNKNKDLQMKDDKQMVNTNGVGISEALETTLATLNPSLRLSTSPIAQPTKKRKRGP